VIMTANDGERKAARPSAGCDGIAAQTAAEGRGVNGFPDIAVTNILNNSLKSPALSS
jgi:hypothetical protein